MVPIPEPGTDMSRVMIANALMRRERDKARAEVERLRGLLGECDHKAQAGLCQMTHDGAREFLKDIRRIANTYNTRPLASAGMPGDDSTKEGARHE